MSRDDFERQDNPLDYAQKEIESLQRVIHGMPQEGVIGLRERVEALEGAIKVASEERRELNAKLALASTALRWLGPGGVMIIIGFLAYIARSSL